MTIKLNEYLESIKTKNKEKVKNGGRLVSTWSKKDFDNLLTTMLNDVDYETEVCGVKHGEKVSTKIHPVKDFREKFVKSIMETYMDEADAQEKSKHIKFSRSQVESMYPVISEAIYKYMESGKKFSFLTKDDFVGSISIKNMPETVTENKRYNTKTKRKAFKTLKKRSTTPSWLKERIK